MTSATPEHLEEAKVRRVMSVQELPWKAIFDAVTRNETQSQNSANVFNAQEQVKSFYQRLLTPFHLAWFLSRSPQVKDDSAIRACLETTATDELTIKDDRLFTVWPMRIHYEFLFRIYRGESDIVTEPEITIKWLFITGKLKKAWQVLVFHFLMTSVAALFMLFALLLLLYGFINFLAFLTEPWGTIARAWKEAPVGISLLCFLVGLAGVGGRGISHLMHLALSLWQNLKGLR